MRLTVLALAASMALGGEAVAAIEPTPPAALTWMVLRELNDFYADIDFPTDRPPLVTEVPEGVLKPVDINHDGVPDWLIDWQESAQFCGTGGCERTLYISGGETSNTDEVGYLRAFDRQALEFSVVEVGGKARIEAWVHHLECADERPECRYAWTWDDTARRLIPAVAGDGREVLDGGGPVVIDDGEAGLARASFIWPSALETVWRESRLVCTRDYDPGFDVHHIVLRSLPDVNEDGRPDWLVVPATACDYAPGAWAFQIWTTNGEGQEGNGVAMAYEATADQAMRLRLAPEPVILVSTACAEEGECVYASLRWDAETATLKP